MKGAEKRTSCFVGSTGPIQPQKSKALVPKQNGVPCLQVPPSGVLTRRPPDSPAKSAGFMVLHRTLDHIVRTPQMPPLPMQCVTGLRQSHSCCSCGWFVQGLVNRALETLLCRHFASTPQGRVFSEVTICLRRPLPASVIRKEDC